MNKEKKKKIFFYDKYFSKLKYIIYKCKNIIKIKLNNKILSK